MRNKSFLFVFVIIIVLIIASCFPTDPPKRKVLPIQYRPQEQDNYCSVACIQMWSIWHGYCPSQAQIADYVWVGTSGAFPEDVLKGVRYFTDSWNAHLAQRCLPDPAAQGDIIAATVTGIKYDVPSIMPFYGGIHSVLVRGYEGEKDPPIAEALYIHDPDPWIGSDVIIASDLKDFYFLPVQARFFAIIGERSFLSTGIQSHHDFVENGGTYYGGPQTYDPFVFIE
jgi:hypothetical protein